MKSANVLHSVQKDTSSYTPHAPSSHEAKHNYALRAKNWTHKRGTECHTILNHIRGTSLW
jgi:hypothetical protein